MRSGLVRVTSGDIDMGGCGDRGECLVGGEGGM